MRTRSNAPAGTTFDLKVDPRRAGAVLGAVVVVLTVLSLAGAVVSVGLGLDAPGVNTWTRYFWVDREGNVPTWFSSAVLGLAALLAVGVAADSPGRWRRHWRVLAAALAYLSVDELTEIHEQAITPLRQAFGLDGALFFAWVVVALPLVVVFALAYLRFLVALPRPTRSGLLVAGALYVGGAAGVEMVGSLVYSTVGLDTMLYVLVTTVEELLEMAGAVLLVVVLAAHRRRSSAVVDVRTAPAVVPEPDPAV